jgi:hypothetical protein
MDQRYKAVITASHLCVMCMFVSDEKTLATIKVLLYLLPTSGRNKLSGAEAFSKIFHVVSVCFYIFICQLLYAWVFVMVTTTD